MALQPIRAIGSAKSKIQGLVEDRVNWPEKVSSGGGSNLRRVGVETSC